MSWIAKRSTSRSVLKSNDCCNIASADFINIVSLIGKHTDETTNAFLIASSSI